MIKINELVAGMHDRAALCLNKYHIKQTDARHASDLYLGEEIGMHISCAIAMHKYEYRQVYCYFVRAMQMYLSTYGYSYM